MYMFCVVVVHTDVRSAARLNCVFVTTLGSYYFYASLVEWFSAAELLLCFFLNDMPFVI